MCNGRSEMLGKVTEIAVGGAFSEQAPKASHLVVTVEGLLANELTVQNSEFNARQLPRWFNREAFETVGDAKWKLFCEELDLVKRGYRCTNFWLQQYPWIILGMVTVVPHACFAGICLLIAGGRFERQQLIEQHKELTDKFVKGKLVQEDLLEESSVKPLSCTNWEQLFLNCGYEMALSTRTETIMSKGQEENYFIDITFSATRNESTS
jgi:hypothetical protein